MSNKISLFEKLAVKAFNSHFADLVSDRLDPLQNAKQSEVAGIIVEVHKNKKMAKIRLKGHQSILGGKKFSIKDNQYLNGIWIPCYETVSQLQETSLEMGDSIIYQYYSDILSGGFYRTNDRRVGLPSRATKTPMGSASSFPAAL